MHTKNILVQGDRGYLIDYQYSGPGHPATDLAKIEMSLFLSHFHQLASDSEIEALQRDLTLSEDPADALIRKHGPAINTRSNEAVIRMCVMARDACRRVLAQHGLRADHYRSVKLLRAWEALLIPKLQQGLARAAIRALS
jgi:thiamine kinase-like enzyme